MNIEVALFYAFSGWLLGAAAMVLMAKRPVHAVLSLILVFLGAAGLWLLLMHEFLAMTLIVVYVGAVMVLFLFVVMMIEQQIPSVRQPDQWLPLAIMVMAIVFSAWIHQMYSISWPPFLKTRTMATLAEMGRLLFTEHLVSFLSVGLLLLSAMIAAMVLTLHPSETTHRGLSVGEQLKAEKQNRLRLVDLRSPSTPQEPS